MNKLRDDRDSSSSLGMLNLMMMMMMLMVMILLLITMGRIPWVQGEDMKESMVYESAKPCLFKKTLHIKCFSSFLGSLMKTLQICTEFLPKFISIY